MQATGSSEGFRSEGGFRTPRASSTVEQLFRAQEERERAVEQKRAEQLERLKKEKEEADKKSWAQTEAKSAARLQRQNTTWSTRSAAVENRRHMQYLRERKEAVELFLQRHSFAGVNSKRKRSLLSSTYPLHVAAEEGDALMVQYLLEEGAELEKRNSASQTAAQVAQKKNQDRSHHAVLRTLGVNPEA